MPLPDQPSSIASGASPLKGTAQGGNSLLLKWALVCLPLAYLWFRLINNLQLEWTTNPQYGYGVLVPFLCVGLIIRRSQQMEVTDQKSAVGSQKSAIQFFIFALAFLYLPTRLIEAATPEWRPIQWLLGIETVGLTLYAIYLGKGKGWLRQLAFPICFFFVAMPWPTPVEQPIIQTLTRIGADTVIQLLDWMGVPAMVHGNVIEVSTGMVGIDEACSGIRSFQSSLMISLFFGEFYRFSQGRRWLLIPIGLVVSMAFNVGRMTLLTVIAAKKGVAAIAQYHDPAGVTITILCTLVLWGVAVCLKKWSATITTGASNQNVEAGIREQGAIIQTPNSNSRAFIRYGLFLLIWVFCVEVGVQAWYHIRESHLVPGPAWSVQFAQDNPTLKDLPIDETTRNLLRYDEGRQAEWTEPDGSTWQGFYFSWLPGRVAGYLAKRHTPEICLTAIGCKLVSGPVLTMIKVHGVNLPIRSYVFQSEGEPLYVFHCRWEAGASSDDYVAHESARYNLIRAVWAGRGNQGQKVLEFVVSGMNDPEQAKQSLVHQLDKLIQIQK